MRQVPHNLKIIFPFFTVIILDSMGTGMMLPVLAPLMNAQHGILSHYAKVDQHLIYGIILGLWPFCFMLGAPLFGYLSDYWGRKRILLVCLFGSLISFICYIISFHWALLSVLLAGRIIGGVTSGSQGVAQAAIADVSTGKEKAINIAFIAVAMTIGLIVGPLLGGIFSDSQWVSWFNNTTPFYLAGLLALFNIILLSKLLKNQISVRRHNQLVPRLLAMISHRRLSAVLLIFFCFELAWSLYFQSLALLLAQHFYFTNALIGLFSSYIGFILSFALLILVRFFLKIYSFPSVIYRGLWVMFIALLAVFILPGIAIQWILVIPIAIAVAVCYSALIATASDYMTEGQGLLMGVSDAILALAFSITGFLSGILAYESPKFPQLIAAFFAFFGLIIFYFFRRR